MNADAPVLEARRVTRVLPETVPVTLVRDIDLAIRRGEFVAITGPSGSGKSSLLYLLGLLDRPTAGEVLLDGLPTGALDDDDRAGLRLAHLGFVFQFHFLLPELTSGENIMLPMRRAGRLSGAATRERAIGLLRDLDLAEVFDKTPDRLSGGQRQRVAVARALANDPTVVLADEPTGNLDTKNAAAVFDVFERLAHQDGRAVVAVTHDPVLAARADRQVRVVDGRLAAD